MRTQELLRARDGSRPEDFRAPTPEERKQELLEAMERFFKSPVGQARTTEHKPNPAQQLNTPITECNHNRSSGIPWSTHVTPEGIKKGPGRHRRS